MTGLHTVQLAARREPRGTIVALPGIAESAESLSTTLRHWNDRGFDVLGIDPRGHGNSARWSQELLDQHAGDVIVEDILATLDHTPIREHAALILFGHSAGGAAAAAVAARMPDRVGAVILEDPFWRLPVTPLQDPQVAERATNSVARIKTMSPAQRIDEIRAIFPQWPEDELAAWARAKDDIDLAIVADGNVIASRGWPTIITELAAADIPVLVLTGTVRTGMTANHRAILRSLGAEVVVIPSATHFIRRDARDLFHALTNSFLDRHVPAPDSSGAAEEAAASEGMHHISGSRVTPRQPQPLGGPSSWQT